MMHDEGPGAAPVDQRRGYPPLPQLAPEATARLLDYLHGRRDAAERNTKASKDEGMPAAATVMHSVTEAFDEALSEAERFATVG